MLVLLVFQDRKPFNLQMGRPLWFISEAPGRWKILWLSVGQSSCRSCLRCRSGSRWVFLGRWAGCWRTAKERAERWMTSPAGGWGGFFPSEGPVPTGLTENSIACWHKPKQRWTTKGLFPVHNNQISPDCYLSSFWEHSRGAQSDHFPLCLLQMWQRDWIVFLASCSKYVSGLRFLDWLPPGLQSDVAPSCCIFRCESLAGSLSGRALRAKMGTGSGWQRSCMAKVMKIQASQFSGLIWSDVFSLAETVQEIGLLSLQPHPWEEKFFYKLKRIRWCPCDFWVWRRNSRCWNWCVEILSGNLYCLLASWF